MVYIHGGGFVVGAGGRRHSLAVACDSFGATDVILVFLQYRLGFLGFAATGDEALRGNLGLWDQIAALRLALAPSCLVQSRIT